MAQAYGKGDLPTGVLHLTRHQCLISPTNSMCDVATYRLIRPQLLELQTWVLTV